jgi:hypothetical protein
VASDRNADDMTTTVIHSIGTASRNYSTLAAWNAAIPGNLTITRSNTCGTGSTTTAVVLDSGASSTNGYYTGLVLIIAGQSLLITGYTGSTFTATVGSLNGGASAFSGAPSSGTAYVVDSVAYIGQCYNDSTFTEAVGFGSGKTTSATCTITLTTATGQSFLDRANIKTLALTGPSQSYGVLFSYSVGYAYLLSLNGTNLFLSKIQALGTGTAGSAAGCSISGATVSQCVIQYNGNGYNAAIFLATGFSGAAAYINCLLIAAGASFATYAFRLAYGGQFCECTLVVPVGAASSGGGLQFSNTNDIVKNCAVFLNGCTISGTAASSNYNVTDSATSFGTNCTTGQTYSVQFISNAKTSMDFRLAATSTCINAGFTDTVNDPAAIDIVGTSRPQGTAWCVGAWEYTPSITASPFILPASDNPKLRTHIIAQNAEIASVNLELLGQDRFPPGIAGAGPDFDWPNPIARRFNSDLLVAVWETYGFLSGNVPTNLTFSLAPWHWTPHPLAADQKQQAKITTAAWHWTPHALTADQKQKLNLALASWHWTPQPLAANTKTMLAIVARTWTWATQPMAANQRQKVAIAKAAWHWTASPLAVKVVQHVTVALAAWHWIARALTANAKTMVEIALATWTWTAAALLVTKHFVATIARVTWAWAASALSANARVMMTIAAVSWRWIANVFAGYNLPKVTMVRAVVRGVVRAVVRGNT